MMEDNFKKDSFFVGYSYASKINRRHFWKMAVGFGGVSALLGLGWSAFQRNPGNGSWDMSHNRVLSGYLEQDPYPVLWTRDFDSLKPVLLYGSGKCGAQNLLSKHVSGMVSICGSILKRYDDYALSIAETKPDWIQTLSQNKSFTIPGPAKKIADLDVEGEILDSKCWFGAMRPGDGKAHKSCAILCIAQGIAPALFVKGKHNQSHLLIITDEKGNGLTHSLPMLSYVGDPIRVHGEVYQRGPYKELRIQTNHITRL